MTGVQILSIMNIEEVWGFGQGRHFVPQDEEAGLETLEQALQCRVKLWFGKYRNMLDRYNT